MKEAQGWVRSRGLASLMQLALGGESLLYCYKEDKKTFQARKDGKRMSGNSLGALNDFSVSLIRHGNRFKNSKAFVADQQ